MPPKAAPPRRAAPQGPPPPPERTAETALPDQLLPGERLVDLARGRGQTSLPVGSMLDASPEALDELEHIASFDDERDAQRRSRAYFERLEVAIDGALATLDEERRFR